MLPEEQRSATTADEGRAKFAEVARVLSQALNGKPFLLGDQFSAADVMIGSTLAWASFMGLLNDHPELKAYVKRLSDRPAFQRSQTD